MSDVVALKNKQEFPTDEVLKRVLGDSYVAFEKLLTAFEKEELVPEWNYYNDGKAWLCKILSKKKNLGWLIVYDKYFVVSCYFTEKHLDKIADLNISDSIKESFYTAKSSGKLIPMPITIETNELPEDVLKMILFKKSLK